MHLPDNVGEPRPGLLKDALKSASHTKLLTIRSGALHDVPEAFRSQFGSAKALIIADPNTFNAAGNVVAQALRDSGVDMDDVYQIKSPDLYAEYRFVEELDSVVSGTSAIPIAVGSGTINDLTKLAAHRAGRAYMSVPTAASMDGYTAYGASITYKGSKQTFDCPAPKAVVADLNVICAAPDGMNASGYADLLAKVTAGADWILADALGEEAIDPFSWELVQVPLRYWVSDADAVRQGDPDAVARLLEGLMMGGFAMQHLKSSRPASGAEHQFSHLWDMQHHTHDGHAPSHGFKVGIGTLASAAMHEELFKLPLHEIDISRVISEWPDLESVNQRIREVLGDGELAQKALEETAVKYPDRDRLKVQLESLKSCWPELRNLLREHLPARRQLARMLAAAGAPVKSEQIGISKVRLRESFEQAYYIRRRFTVLDLAMRCGVFERSVEHISEMDSAPSAELIAKMTS